MTFISWLLLLFTFNICGSLTVPLCTKLKSIKSVLNEINLVFENVSQNISLCNCGCWLFKFLLIISVLLFSITISSFKSFFSSWDIPSLSLSYISNFFLLSVKYIPLNSFILKNSICFISNKGDFVNKLWQLPNKSIGNKEWFRIRQNTLW